MGNTAQLPTPALVIEPDRPAGACVILLHGLGADGRDLAPLAGALPRAGAHAVRFVFPQAPRRPVTLNGGYVMPAWYDIQALSSDAVEDEAGIQDSARRLHEIVQAQAAAGIPTRRIVVGGFSQGGAIALYAGLTLAERLGGILAMSTYLPLSSQFQARRPDASPATPIMMVHGAQDTVVPLDWGRLSLRRLQQLGFIVTWRTYPMGHTICDQELENIDAWLDGVLRS